MPRQPHDDAADSLRRAIDASILANIYESQVGPNTAGTGTGTYALLSDTLPEVSSSLVTTPIPRGYSNTYERSRSITR